MSHATTAVRDVSPGWTWRVYLGCELDADGRVNRCTADRIVGGWAATEERAERAADERLGGDGA